MSTAQKALDALAERVVFEGERVRAELRAGLEETRNGQRIVGARPVPIPAGTNSFRAANGRGRFAGWSLREATGSAPATVTVYDGLDSTADPIATVVIPAGTSTNQPASLPGVSFGDGVAVTVSGAVLGSLYFGVVD